MAPSSNHLRLVSWTRQLTWLKRPSVSRSLQRTFGMWWNGRLSSAGKSAAAMWRSHVNVERISKECFQQLFDSECKTQHSQVVPNKVSGVHLNAQIALMKSRTCCKDPRVPEQCYGNMGLCLLLPQKKTSLLVNVFRPLCLNLVFFYFHINDLFVSFQTTGRTWDFCYFNSEFVHFGGDGSLKQSGGLLTMQRCAWQSFWYHCSDSEVLTPSGEQWWCILNQSRMWFIFLSFIHVSVQKV